MSQSASILTARILGTISSSTSSNTSSICGMFVFIVLYTVSAAGTLTSPATILSGKSSSLLHKASCTASVTSSSRISKSISPESPVDYDAI